MIKLKKIAAIALAATMCMGLSMTAFAVENGGSNSADAGSSEFVNLASPEFADVEGITGTRQTDGKGTVNTELELNDDELNKKSNTYKSIDTTNEVLDILSENGLGVPKGATVIPIAMRQVTGLSETAANVVTFTLSAAEFSKVANDYDETKFHAGDTVYAMMETGENTGVWEMVPGTLNDKGEVDFTVDHTGTIILVKAMKNGKMVQFTKDSNGNDVKPPVVVDPENPNPTPVPTPDDNNNGTSTNPSNGQNANGAANAAGNAWTSPKTGEF